MEKTYKPNICYCHVGVREGSLWGGEYLLMALCIRYIQCSNAKSVTADCRCALLSPIYCSVKCVHDATWEKIVRPAMLSVATVLQNNLAAGCINDAVE